MPRSTSKPPRSGVSVDAQGRPDRVLVESGGLMGLYCYLVEDTRRSSKCSSLGMCEALP